MTDYLKKTGPDRPIGSLIQVIVTWLLPWNWSTILRGTAINLG